MKHYRKELFTLIILLTLTSCSTVHPLKINSFDECANAGFIITYGIPAGCCTSEKCFYDETTSNEEVVERKKPNMYDVLRGECHQKSLRNNSKSITDDIKENMFICCLETVEKMRKHNYKKADIDKNGKALCPSGFRSNLFRCGGSFAWCEPDDK